MNRFGRPIVLLLTLAAAGCVQPPRLWPRWSKEAPFSLVEKRDPLDYPTVGADAGFEGTDPIRVEGIGLVHGLAGTGGNPPFNQFREMMLDEMNRREIENPKQILASPETALVLLRAHVPPGARKNDLIDVEVWVPRGDETASLEGGHLLEASLYVYAVGGNRVRKGNEWARVDGPILVLDGPEFRDDPDRENLAERKRGVILGRARILKDRDFRIGLGQNTRSVPQAKLITKRLNQRFHSHTKHPDDRIAVAKTDKIIEYALADAYRFDVDRYLLVTQRVPLSNSPSFEHWILGHLEPMLQQPATALEAALRLEAIGKSSIPILQGGLTSDSEIVRFASAQALAYLGDGSGALELGRLAEQSNLYRVYAVTALAALDHPRSRMELRRLMRTNSAEACYGAFRASWMTDRTDPLLRGEVLGEAIALHQLASDRAGMIHVSRNFRQEIVLFGRPPRLRPPFSLQAGDSIFLNGSEGNDTVHLASIRRGPTAVHQRRLEATLDLADVLRQAVELGATYADLVAMLQQASANGNLPGRLEIDALPKALGFDSLTAIALNDETKAPGSSLPPKPSLFARFDAGPSRSGLPTESDADPKTAGADAVRPTDTAEPNKRRWPLDLFRRTAN